MPAFITDSARKHGVDDADIWNCYRYPYDERWNEADHMWFAYGFDLAGRPLAVGFYTRDDGLNVINHALRGEIPPAP